MNIFNKIVKETKNKENFVYWIMPIISGILTGLLQVIDFPFLSAGVVITIAPLFIVLIKATEFKKYIKGAIRFSVPYYLIQMLFLTTITELIPFAHWLAVIGTILVILLLTFWSAFQLCLVLSMGFFAKANIYIKGIIISLLFTLGEFFQEVIPIFSFPWSRLENTVVNFTPFSQTASLFGGTFLTFIILIINCFFAIAIILKKKKAILPVALAFSVFFGNLITGAILLKTSDFSGEALNVLIAQSSTVGADKYGLTAEQANDAYVRMLSAGLDENVDIVVLTETAIPTTFEENYIFNGLSKYAKDNNCVIVTGCFADVEDKRYNSVVALEPDGTASKPYSKSVLIPFGEYAPFFESLFPFNSLDKNDKIAPIETSFGTLGVNICIESIYSQITREQMQKGSKILLIPTNDSWFGESFGRDLHYRHSQMKAIESGRFVLRSGNCGISAILAPDGTEVVSRHEKTEGYIKGTANLITKNTLYTKIGDVIIIPALIAFVYCVACFIKSINIKIKEKKQNKLKT
ncbi:MAG: apolipoprotein N-acyltransferase [Clostridiales bacterium]|mgnify:CR=1 FL=1|nr:apolipoprotein N-acyltransferase [Clostridiales bacterium]